MDKDVLMLDSSKIDSITELLSKGATVPLKVTGLSMRPTLNANGDTVYLKSFSKDDVKVGLIVLYKRENGKVILHRIRKVLGDNKVLINGDGQDSVEIVPVDRILAKVVRIRHNKKEYDVDSTKQKIKRVLWYPTLGIRKFLMPLFRK